MAAGLDQFLSDFKRVQVHLHGHKHIIDAHIVDFFTSNHWETLVSPKLRKELLGLSELELCSLHSVNVDVSSSGKSEPFAKSLLDFIYQARISQLASFSWVKDRREFISGEEHDFISHVMAPKKAYEVESMAEVIYFLSKKYGVRKILDLGSGKGYLSQALALQYGLPVVGIDSSDNNTQSAQKRNEKLLKAWRGLLRKSKTESNQPHKKCTDEKRRQLCSCCTDTGSDVKEHEKCSRFHRCSCSEQQSHISLGCSCDVASDSINCTGSSFSSVNPCEGQSLRSTCRKCQSASMTEVLYTNKPVHDSPSQQSREQMDDSSANNSRTCSCGLRVPAEGYNSNKCVCSDQVNLRESPDERGNSLQSDLKGCYKEVTNCTSCNLESNDQVLEQGPILQGNQFSSFIPVTRFVDKSLVSMGELEKLFAELGGQPDAVTGLFLIGLHTCGDLGPTALKLFTSEPDVKLICLVGCCYHLLTQKFDGNNAETDPGFPMSEFLKQQHFAVSRNATMVAQQAADRVASQTKLPPKSVLHRAILQVILKEKFGLDGRGLHVGKIASKCRTFTEYVRKGLDKLGLQDSQDKISDAEISMYLGRYEDKLNHIRAFHQLRVVTSPCIESIFLMDRLCYLYEQGFTKASIVRLFDPVRSPRCYAIIAAKDQQ